jgi:hypothetical protein
MIFGVRKIASCIDQLRVGGHTPRSCTLLGEFDDTCRQDGRVKKRAAFSNPALRKSRVASPPTQSFSVILKIFARRAWCFAMLVIAGRVALNDWSCDPVARHSTKQLHTNPGLWEPCSGGRFSQRKGRKRLRFHHHFRRQVSPNS